MRNIDDLLGHDFTFVAPAGRGFNVRVRVRIIAYDPNKGVRIARVGWQRSDSNGDDRNAAWVPLPMFRRAFRGWSAA